MVRLAKKSTLTNHQTAVVGDFPFKILEVSAVSHAFPMFFLCFPMRFLWFPTNSNPSQVAKRPRLQADRTIQSERHPPKDQFFDFCLRNLWNLWKFYRIIYEKHVYIFFEFKIVIEQKLENGMEQLTNKWKGSKYAFGRKPKQGNAETNCRTSAIDLSTMELVDSNKTSTVKSQNLIS